MSALVEFEERLAAVIATAKMLRGLCDVKEETGFTPDTTLLHDCSSKLAWACNYLSVAGLKLTGEAIRGMHEDKELLPGPDGKR